MERSEETVQKDKFLAPFPILHNQRISNFIFLNDSNQPKGHQGTDKLENYKKNQTIVLITPGVPDLMAMLSITARPAGPAASLPELDCLPGNQCLDELREML